MIFADEVLCSISTVFISPPLFLQYHILQLKLHHKQLLRLSNQTEHISLLELSELQEAMKKIQSNNELSLLSFKAQCSYVAEVFQEIADRKNIKLQLNKKK